MKTTRTTLLFLRAIAAGVLVLFAGTASSPAQVTQTLSSTPPALTTRDNYNGAVGCKFVVGATNVIVSHLGVFDMNNDGLAASHQAGVFSSSLGLLGQVVVPAGTDAYLTNGFRWVPLDPPLLLKSNTTYQVAGVVSNVDNDVWQDAFTPAWNTFFIGATATSTRHAVYGPGYGNGVPIVWPPPSLSLNGNNNTYGNVSLAYIEIDQARAGVQTTNVSISAGQTLAVTGFASGQPPISYQWYVAPNIPLNGQTNASLVISNSITSNSGTYFLTASNAMGGEQSANVTVSVTSIPVGITQQPTNAAVYANYPATFSVTAAGSPPISYQWSRNGVIIPGATTTVYSLTASLTNNGDVYVCMASNFTSGTAYAAASSNATLTVTANLAQPQQILHGARSNATNNFGGLVGGIFGVGNSSVPVTHLGYYASQFTDTNKTTAVLTLDHHVGIFSADGSVLYGSVIVPAGTNNVVGGYMWAALNPPLVLSNNTSYLLVAEVFSGTPTPDHWGDTYSVPDWNPYFTGANGASTSFATYWGAAWPNAGASGKFGGQMYSAPNLAILAPSAASAFVAPTDVSQYVGFNVTLAATVDGQAPLTLQWYKAPGTLLSGQTNLTLNLNNLALGDSGDYYVVVTNPGGPVQSGNATVTVQPDVGPSITQDIQSQSVFAHQTVQFSATVSGTPTLGYQWTFNGSPISRATGSVLTLTDVSPVSVGNYQLNVTNAFGTTNSSVVSLTVTIPTFGSYPAAVMGSNLVAYYRFSDVNSGNVATNQGSLGFAYNGTYEGGYSGMDGPLGFSNFETNNLAVTLDGFTGDIVLPSLNNVTVTNLTIAAWVYDGGNQPANTAIFFHRQADVFGLTTSLNPTVGGDELRYTWNGTYFSFSSGLLLPVNQWAFVALVIQATNATLYLQNGLGMQSTNNAATHTASSFTGNSYIGRDTAGGATGRRWTGGIDEVMIFNKALSPAAVNGLYQGLPVLANLTITRSAGNNLIITWPAGTLQEATNITGPWSATSGAANGSYTVSPSAGMKFYRAQLQ